MAGGGHLEFCNKSYNLALSLTPHIKFDKGISYSGEVIAILVFQYGDGLPSWIVTLSTPDHL